MGKTVAQVEVETKNSAGLMLSARRKHGRAVNAVADYLRSHLRVPNIYIEPSIAGLSRVDVLAADSAGSGDIHAVEIKLLERSRSASGMRASIEQIKEIPAHYKYLALSKDVYSSAMGSNPDLFSPDGLGRVGVILISETDGLSPSVELAVKPERFRVRPNELLKEIKKSEP
jgi:hypothetical protein